MGALIATSLVASGCDKEDAGAADAAAATGAKGDAQAEAKGDAGGTQAAEDEVFRTFAKEQRKKGCEMFTPAMAAKVLELPESDLQQMKIMGCTYTKKEGDDVAEASLMSIWTSDNEADAIKRFENSTKNRSKEEIAAAMAKVTEKAKEREEIDTKVKEKTVDQMGGLMADMTPDAGYVYEDVPGVGDQARVEIHEGSLTVRVGNMQFNVHAYKGPGMEIAPYKGGDPKSMIEAAKIADRKWKAETAQARRELAIVVAKEIVANL